MMSKMCSRCKRELPVTKFYRRRSNADGYATNCLECGVSKTRRDNAARKARMASDPDFAAAQREYGKQYRRRIKSEVYNRQDLALMGGQS